MANEHEGRPYPIFRLEKTAFAKAQDPCHSGDCVDRQVAGGNDGFAGDYIETRADPASAEPVIVMGFYDGEQLPVYDFLVRRFCVCDRWFYSLKGATFPNRLYAAAGRTWASSRSRGFPRIAGAWSGSIVKFTSSCETPGRTRGETTIAGTLGP
jgi:phospholipase C